MGLFADWCNWQQDNNNRKQFWKFTERDGGRAKIAPVLPDILRSHYDDMGPNCRGYSAVRFRGAAVLLAEHFPGTRAYAQES
jgi:hypothetical protein